MRATLSANAPTFVPSRVVQEKRSSPQDVSYQLVETPSDLEFVLQRLRDVPRFAFDTEFMTSSWKEGQYDRPLDAPVLCLIQVAIPDGSIFVIDVLTLARGSGKTATTKFLQPFWEMVGDARIEKVVHAADAEARFCLQETDRAILPQNVFDTQIAARFADVPLCKGNSDACFRQLGLKTLVERLMQVSLEKEMRKCNWMERPLSSEQLAYAACDVAFLLAIREKLDARLRPSIRHCVVEDCDSVCKKAAGKEQQQRESEFEEEPTIRLDPLQVLYYFSLCRCLCLSKSIHPANLSLSQRTMEQIIDTLKRGETPNHVLFQGWRFEWIGGPLQRLVQSNEAISFQ